MTGFAVLRIFVVASALAAATAVHAADQKQMEDNKKVVTEFYDLALNQKNFEAASKFIGRVTPSTIHAPLTDPKD